MYNEHPCICNIYSHTTAYEMKCISVFIITVTNYTIDSSYSLYQVTVGLICNKCMIHNIINNHNYIAIAYGYIHIMTLIIIVSFYVTHAAVHVLNNGNAGY